MLQALTDAFNSPEFTGVIVALNHLDSIEKQLLQKFATDPLNRNAVINALCGILQNMKTPVTVPAVSLQSS